MDDLVIIPARGGSKRIPHKNIKEFLGKPIIAYAIENANSCKFAKVMVSTDDEEIAMVAREYGAEVPFMRNINNSGDYSTTRDVILEVIDNYKKIKQEFKRVYCLYPTTPLLVRDVLFEAKHNLEGENVDSTITVTRYSYPPQRGLKMMGNYICMVDEKAYHTRSQDLEVIYHDCGQLYGFKPETLTRYGKMSGGNCVPIVLRESCVQDIDTEEDWKIAEIKYKMRGE